MENFNETIGVITNALNHILHEKGKKGEFVINSQRIKVKFNIWEYKMELLWIAGPGVSIPVYALQDNFPVPSGKEQVVRDQLLIVFVQRLFEHQSDIWNLIDTSQH